MFGTDALLAAILIAQLSSPVFSQRQSADIALRSLGERALPVLSLHAGDSDPEVRRRVNTLIAATLPARVDRMFARNHADGGVPWCDAIGFPHPKWKALYCEYASDPRVAAQSKLEEQKHYPAYRAITRLWLTDEVYSGRMTLEEAEQTLAAMAARHPLWQGGKWMDEASEE